nr:formate dehydrogenase [Deltaproteobacteria bacterium]
MAKTAKIDIENGELLSSLREFFRTILELGDISAILVPQKLPMKNMVMPTLVSDPAHL